MREIICYSFFPKQENSIDLTFLILILKVSAVKYYFLPKMSLTINKIEGKFQFE